MGIELLTPYTKVELEIQKTRNRRQIGLFSGRFAPIHMAHLAIADQVAKELNLERVLFMPEFDDEEGTIVEMLARALHGQTGFGIETARLNSPETLFETLQTLVKSNPETDFYFIAGSDVIGGLSALENAAELVKLVQLVGVQRPRFRTGTSLPILWIDVPQMDLSSKALRDMMRRGNEPKFLVPDAVLDFIKERGLYGL
ncbi:nicotinate-nucleotide adenylyltransferase [Pseudolactococcus insecticola]|uniref:Probable nicotinate-nucleotide adenylyltransferase n=1 Tax=Pseudolactococcus insecticola TaxID=2709158 RepID=A0A6A0B6Y5_9LACT|nr:nicotinate-nucleotide adenylyltransferase [Lactococcus insecticola]GFH40433.1 putative nicotinate-nucleotide adenylyltransferase [Lactococcus insecticola]